MSYGFGFADVRPARTNLLEPQLEALAAAFEAASFERRPRYAWEM